MWRLTADHSNAPPRWSPWVVAPAATALGAVVGCITNNEGQCVRWRWMNSWPWVMAVRACCLVEDIAAVAPRVLHCIDYAFALPTDSYNALTCYLPTTPLHCRCRRRRRRPHDMQHQLATASPRRSLAWCASSRWTLPASTSPASHLPSTAA